MTAKHMSITVDDEGAYAKVIIVLKGEGIHEYVTSGEWRKEQAKLTERLDGFLKEMGHCTGKTSHDYVRLNIVLPKTALIRQGSLYEIAEEMLRCILASGWKETSNVRTSRSVQYELSA